MPNFACYIAIQNDTGSSLSRADYPEKPAWGYWKKKPVARVEAHSETQGIGSTSTSDSAWDIRLKDQASSSAGSEGWVIYETEDGCQIQFRFECPLHQDNAIGIDVENNPGNRYIVTYRAATDGDKKYRDTVDPSGHPVWVNFFVKEK